MHYERTEHAMTAAPQVAVTPDLTLTELVQGFASHFYARPYLLGSSPTLDLIAGTDDIGRMRDTIVWWRDRVGGQVTAERWPDGAAYVVFSIPSVRIEGIVPCVEDDPDMAWYGRLGLTVAEVKA
jgi:hypothetical protein